MAPSAIRILGQAEDMCSSAKGVQLMRDNDYHWIIIMCMFTCSPRFHSKSACHYRSLLMDMSSANSKNSVGHEAVRKHRALGELFALRTHVLSLRAVVSASTEGTTALKNSQLDENQETRATQSALQVLLEIFWEVNLCHQRISKHTCVKIA